MPQDYWIEIGVTPTYMVSWMTTQYKNWQNSLSGQWVNSIKPIVGAGQGWSSTSGTVDGGAGHGVRQRAQEPGEPRHRGRLQRGQLLARRAAPAGRLGRHSHQQHQHIPTNAPVIANVSDGNVTLNSATITWTTDQSSDSVVEYGLDTSYGSAVTNSTPMYYHTVVLNGLSASTTLPLSGSNPGTATIRRESPADHVFTTAGCHGQRCHCGELSARPDVEFQPALR